MAGWVSERTSRSARRLMLAALLAVLAVGVWGAFAVFAAPPGPSVSGFTLNATSPRNGGSVSWSVIFSEPVTGVAQGQFALVASGLGGSPAITGLSGSGGSYTVTASTGTGSGTLELSMTSKAGIADAAGNSVSTAMPQTG